MANPTRGPYGTLILDDLDRADGDPGVAWSAYLGYSKPQIDTNQLSEAASTSAACWSPSATNADCEIWGKLSAPGSGKGGGRVLLIARADIAGENYYYFDNAIGLCRCLDGQHVTLVSPSESVTAGYYALACIGDVIKLWVWDGEAWTQILSVTDAGIPDGGCLAVELVHGTDPATLDDFGGGSFAPEAFVAPTISGDAKEGIALEVSEGSWSPEPSSYAMVWQRDDGGGYEDIAGATGKIYIPSEDDRDSLLRARVEASRTAQGETFTGSAYSDPVGPIAEGLPGVALASYSCRASFDSYVKGLLTFDYSEFDGADLFAADWFNAQGAVGAYDDLSSILDSTQVQIGRDSNLTWLPAGSATIIVRDPTGIYNPENVNGPLYGSGELSERLHPIRLEGDGLPIFSGWIRGISWEPSGRKGKTTFECVDLTYWLDRASPIIDSLGATTTGAAIGRILDSIGFTDQAMRDLDDGDDIPDFVADGSKTALQLIEDLLDAERGTFWIAPDGTATYRSRNARLTAASIAVIENEMAFAAPGADFDSIITRVRIVRTETDYLAEATAALTDQNSIGWNDLDPIETPYLISDAAADSLAADLVWKLSQPCGPMYELRLDNRTAYQLFQMLTRSFGDRITVVADQAGLSGDYYLEQIQHQIGGRPRHSCSWLVSKAMAQDAIAFDLATFDEDCVFVY